MNSFGHLFRISTFGESHGSTMGVVIDGCTPGLEISGEAIQHELNRRRPGQSQITTQRAETDVVDIVSGVFDGKTTGAPITLLLKNHNATSADYEELKTVFRPSHADYTYQAKYGIRDHRGGGRASARETANWVAAGAIAKLLLKKAGVRVVGFTKQIGHIRLVENYDRIDLALVETNEVRCPKPEKADAMKTLILQLKEQGDSTGGVVQCVATGLPAGLGEPVFGKLNAALAHAMMSIHAAKGFELGSGFDAAAMAGSRHNDPFVAQKGMVKTVTNHSGGIQGGISNGMPVWFNVAFKPASSIGLSQLTIDNQAKETEVEITGRHDPCVVPRAVPVVEAMTALVLADFMLLAKRFA